MGSNIVEVSSWAFFNAHKLERVIWRKSKITEVPQGCFGNCVKIDKISIPSCVKVVQKGSFFDCSNMRTLQFDGLETKANEEMFCRVEKPSYFPHSYWPRHQLKGSTICEFIGREVDPSTFPTIEVIVPKGCLKNYSFSPIYNHDIRNTHEFYGYGIDRQFMIREDEIE